MARQHVVAVGAALAVLAAGLPAWAGDWTTRGGTPLRQWRAEEPVSGVEAAEWLRLEEGVQVAGGATVHLPPAPGGRRLPFRAQPWKKLAVALREVARITHRAGWYGYG